LIELVTALDTQPASLMEPFDARVRLSEDTALELAGWGRTRRGVPATRLLAASFQARKLSADRHLVVIDAATGPCSQDSGSPLITRTPEMTPIIVAISSRTEGNLCGKRDGGVSVYARVDNASEFFRRFVTNSTD
jgi:hypothetical protein